MQRSKQFGAVLDAGVVSRGIVPPGVVSLGVVSLGVVSLGVVPFGVVSLGVVSLGVVSLGLVSLGLVSFGAVSPGVVPGLAHEVLWVAFGFEVGFEVGSVAGVQTDQCPRLHSQYHPRMKCPRLSHRRHGPHPKRSIETDRRN
jgi:hypothetical protein